MFALAFTPDGKRLVSSGSRGVIRLWDVGKLQPVREIGQHLAPVWSLTFSPDAAVLASGSFDTKVKLWDAAELKERSTLETAQFTPIAQQQPDDGERPKDKASEKPRFPKGKLDVPDPRVVELLEDRIDVFLENLTNHGAKDASQAFREEKSVYSGKAALAVTPFQKYNVQMPGGTTKLRRRLEPHEYRYIASRGNGPRRRGSCFSFIVARTWNRYYAGRCPSRWKRGVR